MKLKYSNIGFTPKEINEENYSLRAVFSTADIDRHGEVVDQKSWLLDDFMKNPVVLFGHDHGQPPVGKVTGLGYNGDGDLEGEIQFAAKQYPFANVLWNLYKDGFMKAFSVGFSAGAVDVVDEQVILKNNTLFEISTVSVPANAMALAKSKGLNTESLETELAKQLATSLETENGEETIEDGEVEEESTEEKGCPCNEPKEEAKEIEEDKEEKEVETTEQKQTGGDEEKGEVEDELGSITEREQKWENMDPVYEIFGAFTRVYFDSDTKAGDFSKLLKETGELFIKYSGGKDEAKEAIEAFTKGNDVETIAKLKAALDDVEVVVEEDTTTEETVIDTSKSIDAMITDIKEGRVLSKANRSKLEDAKDAIEKILEADKPSEDKSISDDITEALSIKIETPAVRVSIPAKGPNRGKAINKAVRLLLAEKSK
jgi:phage head maturation protease